MQNLEFKSELRDLALARSVVRHLGAAWVGTFKQTDTYYRVPDAKLKKRETEGLPTEWIFYTRVGRLKPKISTFTIYTDSEAKERFGTAPLPVWCTVVKARELYIWEGVRIHLDDVERLGKFLEFEALVRPERNLAKCHALLGTLRQKLGPALGEPIACGYADILTRDEEHTPAAKRDA